MQHLPDMQVNPSQLFLTVIIHRPDKPYQLRAAAKRDKTKSVKHILQDTNTTT
jgi:hypothetical protein